MPSMQPRVIEQLNSTFGPIRLGFTLKNTPQGSAPEHIKEQWVGVTVPVRERNLGNLAICYLDLLSGEYKVNEEPVTVTLADGVDALQTAGKNEAAQYWAPYVVATMSMGTFEFRSHEGEFSELGE